MRALRDPSAFSLSRSVALRPSTEGRAPGRAGSRITIYQATAKRKGSRESRRFPSSDRSTGAGDLHSRVLPVRPVLARSWTRAYARVPQSPSARGEYGRVDPGRRLLGVTCVLTTSLMPSAPVGFTESGVLLPCRRRCQRAWENSVTARVSRCLDGCLDDEVASSRPRARRSQPIAPQLEDASSPRTRVGPISSGRAASGSTTVLSS